MIFSINPKEVWLMQLYKQLILLSDVFCDWLKQTGIRRQ
nr:MAG TPA: hypothetical protein [Caudoviricetes sp.]